MQNIIAVTIGCGGTSSQNCTYFDSNNVMSGACTATICPCGNNICQIRLDFTSFTIAGPSTTTTSVTKISNGNPSTTVATTVGAVAINGQCLTDTFTVTNPSGNSPPTICGVNNNQHSKK